MTDLGRLPENLPVPVDDGAANHLHGMRLPSIRLPAVDGTTVAIDEFDSRWLVLYAYPRTGGPGIELPEDWDLVPGARGCTPQSCAFRDHRADLAALDASIVGVSAQPIDEQIEFGQRMHIPFPLLNDSGLLLAGDPLRLPTFTAAGMTLYRRLTLVAGAEGEIVKVFYPVFPPDRNAVDVIEFLTVAST